MMWWAVWCAVVMVGAGTAAAPAQDSLSQLAPLDLVQIDPSAPDDESVSYAMPSSLGGRYAAGAAPWLYLLAEMPHDSQVGGRSKRRMPSLSIDLPMSVLREKLNQEKERKIHMHQAELNRHFLDDIGKRGSGWDQY
ncbi:diuretic hormone 1 isoform X6 [Plodia interpunctella]|uniref:diuretic hormone 1 isoform X6 n=1 Tax=Plodia interpunctella TaxID=58824 RepID=UPI0023684059|nr:diuretic hormone 1 isoform X6 [Plodia interpunctella]